MRPVLRAAVLGRPIAHSLSPVLHTAAYRVLGLDVDYGRRDLGEDEVLAFAAEHLGAPGAADGGGAQAPASRSATRAASPSRPRSA